MQLSKIWNENHVPKWHIRGEDLQWNLDAQSYLRYEVIETASQGFYLCCVPSPHGMELGIPTNTVWVSFSYTKNATYQSVITSLAKLLEYTKQIGKTRLSFSGEEFHFFPGIPAEPGLAYEENLAHALRELNAKELEVADYAGSLVQPEIAEYIRLAELQAATRKLHIKEYGEGEPELQKFLAKNFPGRWIREYKCADAGNWFCLVDSENKILGFSRIAIRGENKLRTLGALRLPANESGEFLATDSCLGPVGVCKEMQGEGLGKIILGLSLAELKNRGAQHICIDWTDAHKYYQPLQLNRIRNYKSFFIDI